MLVGVYARMHSFPSMVAHTKMCLPTGRPSTWSEDGSEAEEADVVGELLLVDEAAGDLLARAG